MLYSELELKCRYCAKCPKETHNVVALGCVKNHLTYQEAWDLIAMKAVPSVGIPIIRSTVSRVLVADLGNWKYDAKLSTA
jgi:hypothetical protein